MADTTAVPSTPPPRKRHGFLRFIAWFLVIFVILILALYFVGTSSAFFKGVILPRAGKALNATITVSDATISPFKEVYFKDLKVQTTGAEPLLTAPEVRTRYSLMDIIRGNIKVDEMTLTAPTITLVENPDGTSNLDPILKAQKEKAKEKPKTEESKASKATNLDLKKFALTDATIRRVKVYAGGARDTAELSHVNITADDLKNGQTAKFALNADIKIENNPPAKTNGVLAAKLKGSFNVALSPDLKPTSIQGNTHMDVTQAAGGFSELATLATDLDCDVTPTDIKQVALRFAKGETRLGELRVSGPFDMEKTEGRITVQILSIDKQVLNLAGASSGLDFGPTMLNSTNEIQLTKGGSVLNAVGRLSLDKLQVTKAKQTTPSLDFFAQYNVTVDRSASNATLRELTLNGTQSSKPLLHGELTSPMSLSWGNAANAVGDSTLNVSITGLNLADWKPFVGDSASSGEVNAKLQLLSQQGGKLLTFNLDSQIQNLTAKAGSNQISQANIAVVAKGRATDLNKIELSEYSLKLDRQNQPVCNLAGAGSYELAAKSADLQMTLTAALPRLLEVMPQPDTSFTSGKVELKARVVQQQDTMSVTGNLALTDLTGKSGKNNFQGFQTVVDLDVGKKADVIEIRRASGKISEGGKPGGSFDVSGNYNANSKAAQITARLTDFNQNGLRPFLEPLLTGKKLVSVALNGSAESRYNPQGDATMKGEFKVTNLVVSDPTNPAPATPLEATLQVDASVQKQIADLRQCAIILTPTFRAKNELRLTGQVNMSQTNAYQGNVKLAADSMDVTKYYDLFAGDGKTATSKGAANSKASRNQPATSETASTPSGSTSEKEPDAIQLPFRNFVAEVNIGRFYLREVEITNLVTTAKIDGGHMVLNPFKLALNGAPVNASLDIDVGVPGYKYDTSFDLKAVPLPPLVNSFAPERKGKIGGTLTAQAKVTGSGIRGANLKKTLNGNFNIDSTNLNFAVTEVKQPVLKLIINIVGSIPDLMQNPVGAAGSLLGETVGLKQGGLTDELKKSPIDAITARGVAGSGRIELQQSAVQSAAFRAEASGTVTLADVISNSPIQLPVAILLSQSIAKRIGLGGSDTNAAYARMPDFLLIGGTVGKPKADSKKLLAIGGTALGGIVKAIPGTGNTGNLIQGLGGLLGAKTPAANNTNAPANNPTNQPTGRTDSLLKGLNSVLGGNPASTNAPPTKQTGSTNQPATNKTSTKDLLNDLFKSK